MKDEIRIFEHAGNITEDKANPAEKSTEYPDFTNEGVEKAKRSGEELGREIEEAEPGTIVWLAGNSYIPRSRATLKIFSSTLGKYFENSSPDEAIVFSQKKIEELANIGIDKVPTADMRTEGYTYAVDKIVEEAERHPDAKVIIDMPLRIKQISQKDWYVTGGKLKNYQDKLIKDFDLFSEYSENYTNATKKWFKEPDDTAEKKDRTPDPKEVAESYLEGLKRLIEFTHKYVPDRPVKVVVVGHSFEINAMLTYLANNGQISEAGFDKIGGSTIGFTESATLEIAGDEIRTTFRDKSFQFKIPENI